MVAIRYATRICGFNLSAHQIKKGVTNVRHFLDNRILLNIRNNDRCRYLSRQKSIGLLENEQKQDGQMGLLSSLRNTKLTRLSGSTTTSGVGKEEFLDWAAMTEEQQGYYSALTMCKNLRGAGLTFRLRTQDRIKMFTLSLSGKTDKYFFEMHKKYKIRLQFDNSVMMYAYLHAYEQRHATIIDISDEFLENVSDSQSLEIEFVGESGKKVTTKFSLKGASSAIESTIARCNEQYNKQNGQISS